MGVNEPPIRKDVQNLINEFTSHPGPAIWELPAPQARELYRGMMNATDVPVGELAVMKDFSAAGPAGNITVRLFDVRAARGPGPVVYFIHGGGYIMGDLDIASPLCAHMSRVLDLPVAAVDYRLAPEHPFPAAPEDCEAVARWLATTKELGRTVTGLIIVGDSAGGMLTITTTLALRDKPAAIPVLVHAPIVPVVDMQPDAQLRAGEFPSRRFPGHTFTPAGRQWMLECYKPDMNNWRNQIFSADLSNMPAAVISLCDLDILRDEGRAYAAALCRAGNHLVTVLEAKGTLHGYYLMRGKLPSAHTDLAEFMDAVKAAVAVEQKHLGLI